MCKKTNILENQPKNKPLSHITKQHFKGIVVNKHGENLVPHSNKRLLSKLYQSHIKGCGNRELGL